MGSIEIAQLLVSLGGLGVAVRVAMTLQELATTLKHTVNHVEDHEDRLRDLERKHQ